MTTLGDYICKVRTEKRLTQRELAKKAGFAHGTIQKIESGITEHPGIDVLLGIAKALNTDPLLLIEAYKGKEPSKTDKEPNIEAWKASAIEAINNL